MSYEKTPKVEQDKSLTSKLTNKHLNKEVARLREKFPNGKQEYETPEG